MNSIVFWIDRKNLPLETTVEQIPHQRTADALRSLACANHRNRFRAEQVVEMKHRHGLESRLIEVVRVIGLKAECINSYRSVASSDLANGYDCDGSAASLPVALTIISRSRAGSQCVRASADWFPRRIEALSKPLIQESAALALAQNVAQGCVPRFSYG